VIALDPGTRSPSLDNLRLLSDGRSAALLGSDAEVSWWCRPRFDSPPICWSLLDPRGGSARWLEATHAGSDGEPAGTTARTRLRIGFANRVEVWDALVPTNDGNSDLVRLVRALDDDVDVWHSLKLGGFSEPWATWVDGTATFDELASVSVRGGTSTFGADGTALTMLRATRDRWSALVIGDATVSPPDVDALVQRLEECEAARSRTAPRKVSHTHAERVRHALSVLVACTDRDTGAVIASPTTSLPEVVGGDRQFDYRYSWLRDASVAITAASLVGNDELADEYVRFLVDLGPERILATPIRTVDGGTVPDEAVVPDIEGWSASRPVRVGNDASTQLQYDVLGFVLDAIFTVRRGHRPGRRRAHRTLWPLAVALADRAAECCEPSNGIWEIREQQDFVSGDIGRWLALDRALRLGHRITAARSRSRWRRARNEARDKVLGAIEPDGSLPQVYGRSGADASALLLVAFDLLSPRDPRAQRLVDATIASLGAGPLLYRYPPDGRDGFAPGEAPFVPASWWAVTALAKLGHPDAQARADELCHMLPGLQPEEFDPGRREALGNVPLVWSHAECTRALFELDRNRGTLRGLGRRVTRRR
jgi:hypothetical protein